MLIHDLPGGAWTVLDDGDLSRFAGDVGAEGNADLTAAAVRLAASTAGEAEARTVAEFAESKGYDARVMTAADAKARALRLAREIDAAGGPAAYAKARREA